MDDQDLIERAKTALDSAYVPYSDYRVGAAIETGDGTVFTGCNVETANYSNSLHAEEIAVGTAVSAGYREFTRLAVASSASDGVTPCGMCRQTLAEFCNEELRVLCAVEEAIEEHTLGELLPAAISRETLKDA